MGKMTAKQVIACAIVSTVLFMSCKDDSHLAAPPAVSDQSFVEEFDTASAALARGWKFINASEPKGSNVWQQGGSPLPWFKPFSSHGTYAGFIGADYTSTSAGQGTISNWVVSPVLTLQNGDQISFYTRSQPLFPGYDTSLNTNIDVYKTTKTDTLDWANGLQLRISTNGESLNVGKGADVGDFLQTLVDINPNFYEWHAIPGTYDNGVPWNSPSYQKITFTKEMVAQAYPGGAWTRFVGTVSGLNKPMRGRIGFRYFVLGGGSNGRGSGVALDKVEYIGSK